MYLSKLEIFGFKSFAQKVNLAFDAGMTAIVGPNGCGKTNVVDAIRWALGEQKPTMLRSDKMEDVIFNGTKSRKPLGVAEVSITIENSKGILPSEYTEVTITRRVFRSGESEYYLNKTLCRLKDIRDLFMDTGMGSDAYSVIELKMVESILSDNSDERRRLFEESAGVTKYKHRRKEALRRLDSVRADLTRVSDNLRNVEKAVNSLERQAEKAEKYNKLVKQLQDLELDLIQREYASVVARSLPLKDQLSIAVDEKNRIDVEVKQEEALLDVMRSELEELERQLTTTQHDLAERQDRIHRLEQSEAMAGERQRALGQNAEKYQREILDLEQQKIDLDAKQDELVRKLGEMRARITEAEEVYDSKKRQQDEFAAQVEAKKIEVKAGQDRVITLLHRLSEVRNRENQVKGRIENLRGRMEYLTEEAGAFKHEIEANAELIAKLTADNRQLRLAFAEAEVRTHQMEAFKLQRQSEVEELRNKLLDVRGDVERKEARVDFLKGLVESFDGYSEGARYLISSNEWGAHIQTTVGEVLQTEPTYRIAIETALGEAAGYVIVDNVQQAYAAMDFLKKNQKGKATFICLDRLPAVENHRSALNEPGVIDWAGSVVKFDPRFGRLFAFLFDDTVLVQDVLAANRVVDGHHNLRCITLEGEIVTGKGVVRGGSLRQDEGGHISKKSQLEELGEEIITLHKKFRALQKEVEAKTLELEAVNLKKLTDEARSIEQQKTSVEVRIAQLEFEKRRAEENIERNTGEVRKLAEETSSLSAELSTLSPRVDQLESEKTEAERNAGVFTSELETMETLGLEYARAANEAHVSLLNVRAEERQLQQSIEHATSTLSSIDGSIGHRHQEISASRAEIERLNQELAAMRRELTAVREEFTSALERKKSVDHDYASKRTQAHEIELKLKDERLKQEGSLKAAYDLELKLQELTMKADNLKSRAKEKFELDIALKQFPDNDQYDFAAAREQTRVLTDRIRGLGAVNFAAFDEYKSEKERLDFGAVQRDDLIESEKTLLTTIDEINTTAQRQFMETFEKIRENFISTFKGLFDEGDEADLRLDEEVDPLEARIEIVAKPRGKRPTSIDLLSGGEKTLTAIALLFAIYLVKPSPFCILDEVDAPLDDTNIDRFTRIIRKFSDNTQFVIVTHNKRTMESANAMYGVTMEEEGVSKLVSVKFSDAQKN
ncbi:MAG: chromosome segregation protein SMC [Ignavibacteriales bacterium]|nr:chromosome segregation protein SMC [Ignavibacteriales bacterium]